MPFIKTTEEPSLYRHLDKMSTEDILCNINKEDQKVALAIQGAIPKIIPLVDAISKQIENDGRLFYIGAGTSGRLGVLDASECPPTYGVSPDLVIGLIAGGDSALRNSVEHAEDSINQAWQDLLQYNITQQDVVIGIAASGTTPYVVNGLKICQENNITTGCISCNAGAPVTEYADFPIEVVVGPEFVTGSTRMKSGTAQKLILNMISTAVMIKIGRVKDNRMVDMQLSNEKLWKRGIQMIKDFDQNISDELALQLLKEKGSVRSVLKSLKAK